MWRQLFLGPPLMHRALWRESWTEPLNQPRAQHLLIRLMRLVQTTATEALCLTLPASACSPQALML